MTDSKSAYGLDFDQLQSTLKGWPTIVKKYASPSLAKSITQIANTFIPFAALRWLAYSLLDISVVASVLICIINGFFLGRMLIIQHDCSHLSFFPSKRANIWMGNICSIFTLIPFKYRQTLHDLHHRYNGVLDHGLRDIGGVKTMNVDEYKQAPRSKKIIYRMSRHRISLLIIGPFYYFLVAQRVPLRTFDKGAGIIVQQMITTVVIALIIYVLGTALGRSSFLLVHGVTFFTFGILTIWMFYVQHQHNR